MLPTPSGVKHDILPTFACTHSEQQQKTLLKILKQHVFAQAQHLFIVDLDKFSISAERNRIVEETRKNGKNVEGQEDQLGDVDHTGEGEPNGVHQSFEAFHTFNQL
jgi:hypothetical protein